MRACLPSASAPEGSNNHSESFYKAIDDSEWLQGLQTLLHINDAVIDLMDVEKSSVMVCLEDGWDIPAQISSIAQVGSLGKSVFLRKERLEALEKSSTERWMELLEGLGKQSFST